ncbi:MAG: M81 family metallopeptidase [Prevotella sp.]|nr:M81 family metallopeptidase [Prevotella sp.]
MQINRVYEKLRIFTCGIRHESNTFSTLPTSEANFSIVRGADVLKDQEWVKVAEKEGIELIPSLHAYAWPGGVVERSIFEKYKNEILEDLKKAGNLDGIYLDMHGALHVEGYDDAQATFIKEIRDIVGDRVMISGSFDLHGNLSPDFVKSINILTGYRTAPHRDGAETKARAISMLIESLKKGLKPHIETVIIPILIPGEKGITEVEPLHSIYAQIPEIAKKHGLMDASIFVGYAWADLPRSAMRVFVVANDAKYAESAKAEAQSLAQQIWDKRADMKLDVPSGSIDDMIALANKSEKKTVFISDSGDNTTAGAPGDNPQVLAALLKNKTKNVLFAGIVDADFLAQCVALGVGKEIKSTIGGKVDKTFGFALPVKGKIEFLSPDSIMQTDRGAAVLNVEGVKLVVMKTRRSFVTKVDFEEVKLNPLDYKIVVVKLGYLYPELRDLAPEHLMALTSGFCNLEMTSLPFKNVDLKSYPLDISREWNAQ